MPNHISVFQPDSTERRRLDVVSRLLNLFSGLETEVGDTYFDFGQDWRWTTVLGREKDSPDDAPKFQVLSPAQQNTILNGSLADLHSAVQDLMIKYPDD